MTIKAVCFDLDDTLLWDERSVREAFEATCQFASLQSDLDAVQLEEKVRDAARALYVSYETYAFTQNIGINPFEALWAHFTGGEHKEFRMLEEIAPKYRVAAWTNGLLALGIDDEKLGAACAERFMQERRNRPYVYEDTFEVLDKLREQYPLLLLTNGSPSLQQEKLAGVPGIADYFEHIVISGDHPEGKPSQSLFKHALGLLGVKPEETIMVGDKLTTDIIGAIRSGMHNAWINHHGVSVNGDITPEYTISSLSELFDIIHHINQKQTTV